MTRPMDSAIAAQLDEPWLNPVFFVELVFDDGTLHLHNSLGDIAWGDYTWTGTGDFSAIDMIEERADGSPAGTVLRLSGVDATLLTEAFAEDYMGRPVTIYFSVKDATTGALVATPFELFSGQMDQMRVITGETSVIELVVESELILFDSSPLRWFSDSQLQVDYAGDLGFQYLAAMANHKVTIGSQQTILIGSQPAPINPGIPGGGGNLRNY